MSGLELSWTLLPRVEYPQGRLISNTHHPAAENVLRDATLVMEPKRPIAPFTESFKKRLLGAQLAAHFRVADQSALWILYARQQRPADL